MAAKRAAGRTPCNPWDMRFPLCVGRMWDGTMFSSVCALPSPASAEGCCPSLFGWFTGVGSEEARSRAGLRPFGFHLAMDTLPSEELISFPGQRGITPAFGYGPPHPSARRTSTFPNNALLSTHYGTVRLLLYVHVRRAVYGLRRPVLVGGPRRARDLPVLVHVVSQRARVLRLRRTEQSTRD